MCAVAKRMLKRMPSQQLALQIASAALLKSFDLLQNFLGLTGVIVPPKVSRVRCQRHGHTVHRAVRSVRVEIFTWFSGEKITELLELWDLAFYGRLGIIYNGWVKAAFCALSCRFSIGLWSF